MTMLTSQITSLTVVYSIVYSGVNQRKHQSSASLAFMREIHRGPVNFPRKWPVTRKMFPFDDVIMWKGHTYHFLMTRLWAGDTFIDMGMLMLMRHETGIDQWDVRIFVYAIFAQSANYQCNFLSVHIDQSVKQFLSVNMFGKFWYDN